MKKSEMETLQEQTSTVAKQLEVSKNQLSQTLKQKSQVEQQVKLISE